MNIDVRALLRNAFIPITSGLLAVLGYRAIFVSGETPWMWIFLILAIAVGIGIGFFLFKRRKAKQGDGGSAAVDEKALAEAKLKAERDDALKKLQGIWKDAIGFLRQSRLKKVGDPLYVLPWYMVIGEPNAGKTTAIRNARLPSFAESTGPVQVAGTENCQWSFFEQAIVIDTAGRYAYQNGNGIDKAEWDKMLDLLFKYRRKESLNGLVVAVPADKLMNQSPDQLQKEGKVIRKRIDELMGTLGAKFPIYLQVTKCDLIPGMSKMLVHLSEKGLGQTMGGINEEAASDTAAFLDKTFAKVTDRLKTMRLVMAGHMDSDKMDPDLLLLPETLAKLKKGVTSFTQSAFKENPFQETPLLRGLHFSSGRQDDMNAIIKGLDSSKVANWPKDRGVFLHDFFSRILPADRALFVPTRKALHWRREVLSIKVILWLSFITFCAVMMSYSFVKNLNTMRDTDREFSHLASLEGKLANDIKTIDHRFKMLIELDQKNQSRWHSLFLLNEARQIHRALEIKLSTEFRDQVLAPVDKQYAQSIASLTPRSRDIPFSQFVGHLVSRIQLVKERLENDEQTIDQDRHTAFIPYLRLARAEAKEDLKQTFRDLYTISLQWFPDRGDIERELVWLQLRLKRTLALKGNSPRWVVAWANSQHSAPPVTLKDYWGGETAPLKSEPSVPALFSRKNKYLTDSFFSEVEVALGDPAALADLKSEFTRWYRTNSMEAWRKFARAFPKGRNRLNGKEEWQNIVSLMTNNTNPYFALLNDMAIELEPVAAASGENMPPWLVQVYQFQDMKGSSSRSPIARLFIKTKAAKAESAPRSIMKAFVKYQKTLKASAVAVSESADAVQVASLSFGGELDGDPTVFAKGFEALNKLKKNITEEEKLNDPVIWELIRGPLDFLWDYTRRETAAYLQKEWETEVLIKTSGFTGPQALTMLLSDEGPVMGYLKKQAAPFVQWKQGKGFYANKMFGAGVPFTSSFFYFLNRGAKVSMLSKIDNVNVTIASLPPIVNKSADRIPHRVELILVCSGNEQSLKNRRRRVLEHSFGVTEKSMSWTPACNDLRLEIDVAGTQLVKRYPGPYGFFTFMGDFQDGKHTFYRASFPNESKQLAKAGISYIKVRYRIKGAPNLDAPRSVPTNIVKGWNH